MLAMAQREPESPVEVAVVLTQDVDGRPSLFGVFVDAQAASAAVTAEMLQSGAKWSFIGGVPIQGMRVVNGEG